MSRLTLKPVDDAEEGSKPLLRAVHGKLGLVPNLMKMIGNSPAALEGYLALSGSLEKGRLDVKVREGIALATAEFNGCDYCLAAHTYIGRNMVKLSDGEIDMARQGISSNDKVHAALQFARRVARERGRVDAADISALRDAGFTDGEAIEIIAHVALNVLTNYVNNVAETDLDFPPAAARSLS